MKSFVMFVVLATILSRTGLNAQQEFVVNGGFETGTVPNGISQDFAAPDSTSIPSWNITAGSVCLVRSRWVPASGNQCLDLNGLTAGTIKQTLTGLTPGRIYTLSFMMAGNPEALAGLKKMRVYAGSWLVRDYEFNSSGHTTSDLGWVPVVVNFSPLSSSFDLVFESKTTNFGGIALDQVSVRSLLETDLVAGGNHVLAVNTSGNLFSWGANNFGQLGNNTTVEGHSPRKVTGLTGVSRLAAGNYHSIAVKSDGTVVAWGFNFSGQVGDNSTQQRNAPVSVGTLTGMIRASAGSSCSVALKNNGTVWAWGANTSGQLGDGTTTQRPSPVQFGTSISLTDALDVAAGGSQIYVIRPGGTVWAAGQTFGSTPVQVSGLSEIVQVVVSVNRAYALRKDGVTYSWAAATPTPAVITGIPLVNRLGNGHLQAYAITDDGSAWTLETSPALIPFAQNSCLKTTQIDGGGYYVAMLKEDGSIWANGLNQYGQLGDDTVVTRTQAVLAGAASVAVNTIDPLQIPLDHASYVLGFDGTVYGWGNNDGDLGVGDALPRATPVVIPGYAGVRSIDAGGLFSVGLLPNGTVLHTADSVSLTPILVSGLSAIKQIAAGDLHAIALGSNGLVYAWGFNWFGELGFAGSVSDLNFYNPVQVSGLSSVVEIAAGGAYNLARKSDGTVWAWGMNADGQLGDNTFTTRHTPAAVTGLSNVKAISAGYNHAIALKNDGTVVGWGHNGIGSLGDGTYQTWRPTYVTMQSVSGAIGVVAGVNFTFVLKAGCSPLGTGVNWNGEQAVGNLTLQERAVAGATLLDTVYAIVGGEGRGLAVNSASEVLAWGLNDGGQAGTGAGPSLLDSPVVVPGVNPTFNLFINQ